MARHSTPTAQKGKAKDHDLPAMIPEDDTAKQLAARANHIVGPTWESTKTKDTSRSEVPAQRGKQ